MNTATAASRIQFMLECRAASIADRYDIRGYESFRILVEQERYRAFREAIEPWLQMKVRMHRFRLARCIRYWPDGRCEVEYEPWAPETQKALDNIAEVIADEARRHGYPAP